MCHIHFKDPVLKNRGMHLPEKKIHLGLNPWARNLVEDEIGADFWIAKNEDGSVECGFVQIRKIKAQRRVTTRSYRDNYGNLYYLGGYFFPDGKYLYEELQLTPEHSGQAYCLALRDKSGQWIRESLWNPVDMGSTHFVPEEFIRSFR